MKKIKTLFSAVLSCAVLLTSLLPLAFAQGETVCIRNLDDWKRFVQNCRLDTWSQGKTVVLEQDLELSGGESVPTFGGTFEGGGHTISGLELTQEGSHQGLFRYLQEGALVSDLTVEGRAEPAGTCRAVGGVAGVNRGTISRCRFNGTVTGTDGAGGVVGINESTGELNSCTAGGSVSGEHYTGGIAGENYGSIVRCVNEARVNTQETEVAADLDALTAGERNNMESVPACTDTGGIAGYSKGVIRGSTNRGAVGYPHTGYNVGGIVGRQSGIVDGCVNRGSVLGRKDVGGIAGQMEPYILLQFEEDTLQKLEGELDTLDRLLNRTLDSTQFSGNALADHIDRITGLADAAREDVSDMADHLEDWGSGTADTVNEFSARISQVIDQSVPVADRLEEAADRISEGIRQTERALKTLEGADGAASDASSHLQAALSGVEQAMGNLKSAQSHLREALQGAKDILESEDVQAAVEELNEAYQKAYDALEELKNSLPEEIGPDDWEDILTQAGEVAADGMDMLLKCMEVLRRAFDPENGHGQDWKDAWKKMDDALSDVSGTAGRLQDSMARLRSAVSALDRVGDVAVAGSGQLRGALDILSEGTDDVGSAFRQLGDLLEEQAQKPDLAIPDLESAFYEREDHLNSTLSGLTQAVNDMNRTARDSGDSLSGNLRAVNAQLRVIADVLQDAWQEPEEREDYIVDASEDGETTWGQVSGCTNYGAVEGDVNIGGVTGAMAVEYDFDPEDDVTSQGGTSARFQYRTSAVLRGCVNYAGVTARKNNAGGVVGEMDLGLVHRCGGAGSVESTGGQYVGGVAGSSYAAIQGSWAKCTLTGSRYVGGIAGLGTDIAQCRSLVELRDGLSNLGAIAGEIQEEGVLTQNLFVSGELGGVDGVSYAGRAEPLDYSEFVQLEDLPGMFRTFTLTFVAGDETVERRAFPYGAALDRSWAPQVPEREGFYGAWEFPQEEILLFDTVVKAKYTPWLTAVAGADGQILAEGRFGPETALYVEQEGELRWSVRLSEGEFTALRIAAPEDVKRPAVWASADGVNWEQVPCTREGSYLRVELSGQQAQVYLEQQPLNPAPWIALAAAVLAAVCAAAGAHRKKRKKTAKK